MEVIAAAWSWPYWPFLKAWNGTRFFFANICTIPGPRSKHWRSCEVAAWRRPQCELAFYFCYHPPTGCGSYRRVAAVHVLFSMMCRNQALWVLFCLLLFSFTLALFPSFASSGLTQAAGWFSITSFQMALYYNFVDVIAEHQLSDLSSHSALHGWLMHSR